MIYDVSISVFGHLWRPSHHTESYPKDCVPCEGGCFVHCTNLDKNIYPLKKVCPFWRPLHYAKHYSRTTLALLVNTFFHFTLYQVTNESNGGRAIGDSDQLLHVSLVYILPYLVITAPFCNICYNFNKFLYFVVLVPLFISNCPTL